MAPPIHSQLGDNEQLLAGNLIPGYSLKDHRWVIMDIEKLRNIAWDTTAFDSLVFPSQVSEKELVLFAARKHYEPSQESLISNRDAGLIIGLRGPSGSGKTFIVESVAENMKAPLFVLKANELGKLEDAESSLRSLFQLLAKWKGILLLKDADSFFAAEQQEPAQPPTEAPVSGTQAVEGEKYIHVKENVSMFLRSFESRKVLSWVDVVSKG